MNPAAMDLVHSEKKICEGKKWFDKFDGHWKNDKSGELTPGLSKGRRWLLDSVHKLYLRDSAMFDRYKRQWVLYGT